jgi:hypothetical protein
MSVVWCGSQSSSFGDCRRGVCVLVSVCLALVGLTGCTVDRTGVGVDGNTANGDDLPADVGRGMADAAVPEPSGCAPGTIDANGDPSDGCECTPSASPVEICNGADDDCNGKIDDGLVEDCGTSGTCTAGTRHCSEGVWGECEPLVAPSPEVCGGGDEDCDGTIDEDCECVPGDTRDCGTDVGACEFGSQTCSSDGTWGACTGETGPSAEICDGVDNDCDGMVDGMTRTCGTNTGTCTMGVETCVDGAYGACVGGVGPATELCDAARADEDCDGSKNEHCGCVEGETQSCFQFGHSGTRTCDAYGDWGYCNTRDNDWDDHH